MACGGCVICCLSGRILSQQKENQLKMAGKLVQLNSYSAPHKNELHNAK